MTFPKFMVSCHNISYQNRLQKLFSLMLGMLRSRLTSLKMNFNLVQIGIAKHIWLNDYYTLHDQNFDLKDSYLLIYKQ